ncbi:hypothetical protein HOH87_00755 [bacterium]|nr:hypothetical protein [bacterium]
MSDELKQKHIKELKRHGFVCHPGVGTKLWVNNERKSAIQDKVLPCKVNNWDDVLRAHERFNLYTDNTPEYKDKYPVDLKIYKDYLSGVWGIPSIDICVISTMNE